MAANKTSKKPAAKTAIKDLRVRKDQASKVKGGMMGPSE